MTATAFVISATVALGSSDAAAAPAVEPVATETTQALVEPTPAAPAAVTVPAATTTSTQDDATSEDRTAPQESEPTEQADTDAPIDVDADSAVEPVGEPSESVGPITRAMIVLYGDSLAWEAREVFAMALAERADVVERTFGGTAICDWLETMAADALSARPGAVVVEFSGNNFTPCMLDADGAALRDGELVDRYRADAESVIAMFVRNGTQVIFAGSPTASPDSDRPLLNEMYERLAAAHDGVHYVDAGAAVLDQGRWTATLPCLPVEPCEGGVDADGAPVNAVRASDGLHFCPASSDAVDGVTGACPVWSSGAFRFGAAMAAPVIAGLDAAT